jgi:hypothetical protein
MPKSKDIILKYNGHNIPITITDNYEDTIEIIRKQLYLQEDYLKKYNLTYLDEDDYENELTEDDYDTPFSDESIKKWKLSLKNEDIDIEETIKEIKKKLKDKHQKQVGELISNFEKIYHDKITANNKKYEEIIEKLQERIKSLQEKNKKDMDEIKQIHENSIANIKNDVSEFAKKKIEEQFEAFDNELSENIISKIEESSIKINTKSNDLNKALNSMDNNKKEINNKFIETKDIVRDMYEKSRLNINKY